ncbi:MAG: response regulator transcription factor [Burkholderiaceae bacterium]|nr:response regulator transcription factor [Burkholderiaceae bacterium]
MAIVWRDSDHGALLAASQDEPIEGERPTMLLLGFEPARAMTLVRLLSPLVRVRLATRLRDAVDMARDLQPDAIALGGAIDGADVATVLAAFQAGAMLEDIPVIVLAAGDGDASERDALRGGALAWLPHTASAEALLSRVRLAVRMRRSYSPRWGSAAAAPTRDPR